jgi:hypothetical protein
MKLLVTLCALILCGCNGASNDQKTSGEPSPGGSGTTVYSMEIANRCAGFGAAQAAELLAVPASEIEPQLAQVTPTTRGCTFTHRGDPTRQVSFTVSHDDSVDDAKHSFASYRETVSIGSRVQQAATGEKPAEGAYVDILGVGDEAIWSHANGVLNVRRANLTIMVMRPDDKKQQAAVAQKVIAGL